MNRGNEAGSEIRAVRRHLDVVRLTQMNHPDHFADAADLGDARLRDVDGASFDQRFEAEHAGDVFARGDRDAALAYAGQPVNVLRGPDRLLEPEQSIVAEC
jgi:hypothetical protein